MARIVRCGLIQAHCEWSPEKFTLPQIKEKMIAKHEGLIAAAAKRKVQILGLQELFYGPYFCAEQETKWYDLTEPVPGGPTTTRMQKLAKKYGMAMIVPVYEVEMAGVYFDTFRDIFRPRRIRRTENISESIANIIFPTATPDSGRNSISRREMQAIRYSRRDSDG